MNIQLTGSQPAGSAGPKPVLDTPPAKATTDSGAQAPRATSVVISAETTRVRAELSESYFVGYFTHSYVRIATQVSMTSGSAPVEAGQTALTVPDQPSVYAAGSLRFDLTVQAAFSVSTGAGEAAGAAKDVEAADRDASIAPAEIRAEDADQPAAPVFVRFPVAPALRPAVSAPSAAGAAGVSETSSATPSAPADSVSRPASTTVERLDTPAFEKYRLRTRSVSTETAFSLALETREGDRISLDFRQIDALAKTRFRGVDADGNRIRLRQNEESLQRMVNLEIVGDLNDEERAAIDALLDKVVELANAFFGGSMATALEQLRDMDFDSATLLDVSLQMSLTRSVEKTRGYRDGETGVERLAQRDVNVARSLSWLGESQRDLVSEAKDVLEDTSAAALVRSLLPPLLDDRLEALRTVVDAQAGPVDTESTTPDAPERDT